MTLAVEATGGHIVVCRPALFDAYGDVVEVEPIPERSAGEAEDEKWSLLLYYAERSRWNDVR